MKQAIILAVYLTVACFGFARDNRAIHPAYSAPDIRHHDSTFAAIPAPQQMLTDILNVMGLQAASFELKEAKVLNIEASVSNHKRYILYNPQFIAWLNRSTNDKWAVMTLFAHEIGHHLNGHTIRKGGSKPHLELEADEFAGFVLYKLGASLREAQEVMLFIASVKTSKTHPARGTRIRAIQTGWDKAKAADTGFAVVNK